LTSIIEKRKSLHRQLARQQQQTSQLATEVTKLESLANLGAAAAMIAHEINNLLTPIANYAKLARKHPDDPGLTEKALARTEKNCTQAAQIMQSILALANNQQQQKQNANLAELIDDVFTCLCRDFTKDSITVRLDVPSDITIHAVRAQIQQVLMNLILNARDAMCSKGGTLKISASKTAEAVTIAVADTGCGIDTEHIQNIFDRFFTTKSGDAAAQPSGTGIGLAFCRKVIDNHQGTISVDSSPQSGTTFTVTIPN
jgi:signal transduction histidine kinase